MTFSICVHERFDGPDGEAHDRFGVAVTTRLPAVGTLCPFVSERAAIATQSLVNVDLGRRGIQYVEDGLAIDDALEALLNADDGAPSRQLHGVDATGSFAFSGAECRDWFGHLEGDGVTVAGNLLTGPEVLKATLAAYTESDRERPLAERLIAALAAGQAEGGDKRTELSVQSAAVCVETTVEPPIEPLYNDLRVDASKTPVADLLATYERAKEGHAELVERYGDAYEDDDDDAG